MAEHAVKSAAKAAPAVDAAPKKKGGVLGKILSLFAILGIAAGMAVGAMQVIPAPAQTAEMLKEILAEAEKTTSEPEDNAEPKPETVEIDLGEFSVVSYQAVSGTTLRVDVRIVAQVKSADEVTFKALHEGQQHRLRDQFIAIIRTAEVTDLTDAGLGLLKRKILAKTNATLGKPLTQAILFSDFSVVE